MKLPQKWWEKYIPSGEPNIAGWIIPMFNRKYTSWKVSFYNAVLFYWSAPFSEVAQVFKTYTTPYRLSTSITITNGCHTVQIHWNKCKYIFARSETISNMTSIQNSTTSIKKQNTHFTVSFPVNSGKTIPSWWFQPIWNILVKFEIISPSRGEHEKYLKTTT